MSTIKTSVGGLKTDTVDIFQILVYEMLTFLFLSTSSLPKQVDSVVERCNQMKIDGTGQKLKIGKGLMAL